MDLGDRKALLQTFLAEAEERLIEMEEIIVELESRPDDEELVQKLFRGAHTIKGNASCFGFSRVSEFAHALEDLLQRLRSRTLAVNSGLVTLLLRGVDALKHMVPDAVAGVEELQPGQLALQRQLAGATPQTPEESPAGTELTADARKRPFGRREDDAREWLDRTRTLRVDIGKLDRMLNLTGEIAIAQGRLRQMLEKSAGRSWETILEAHREADRLFMELQEIILKVRMVPVGPIFRQYIRTVRDVARAHGKLAHLVIEGEEVEVDTTIVECLKDPLMHMIRNALDHGIESPDRRTQAGKDATGCVTLRALREAGNIVIQVEDDGAGLNQRKIIEKARAMGMLADGQPLSSDDVHRLIFEPGFSTAETVTDLSGRGVGMDVVRRYVDGLRGSIAIESRSGAGTSVTIRLPLTLAIIEGFAVGVGGETYVIPLDAVIECIDLPPGERRRTEGRGMINLRGEALPYLRLRDLFPAAGDPSPREKVVVVTHHGWQAGLVVDELFGERQAVIKPLNRLLQGVPGISGATILGDGRVALILDVSGVLRHSLNHATAEAA
jgi:two-component system chemotaxis sensor kinase CheA